MSRKRSRFRVISRWNQASVSGSFHVGQDWLVPDKIFDLNLQMRNTGISHFFFNANKLSLTGFNAVPHLQVAGRHEFISYG